MINVLKNRTLVTLGLLVLFVFVAEKAQASAFITNGGIKYWYTTTSGQTPPPAPVGKKWTGLGYQGNDAVYQGSQPGYWWRLVEDFEKTNKEGLKQANIKTIKDSTQSAFRYYCMGIGMGNYMRERQNAKEAKGEINAAPTKLHKDGKASEYLAAQGPRWKIQSSSSLRYTHTDYLARQELDGSGSSSDAYGGSIRAGKQWDRFMLDIVMPIDRVAYGGVYDHLDYTRLGVMVTPRYQLLSDGKDCMDMTIGLNASWYHTWFDKDEIMRVDPDDFEEGSRSQKAAMSNFDNTDHFGWGPILSVQKDFKYLTASAGVVFQRVKNLDGDEEITGDSSVNAVTSGFNIGVPITDRFGANTFMTWTHLSKLPGLYDQDTCEVGLGGTYLIKDKWALDLTMTKDFANSDINEWALHMGLGWDF